MFQYIHGLYSNKALNNKIFSKLLFNSLHESPHTSAVLTIRRYMSWSDVWQTLSHSTVSYWVKVCKDLILLTVEKGINSPHITPSTDFSIDCLFWGSNQWIDGERESGGGKGRTRAVRSGNKRHVMFNEKLIRVTNETTTE